MATERSTGRIASTAAWSTCSLSPRPMKRAAAIAAASVARTSSSARLRSGSAGRSPGAVMCPSCCRSGPGSRAAAPRPQTVGSALVGVEPVERAGDRALPVLVVLVALVGVHRRLPALVLDPVLAQVLDLV